MTNTEIIEGLKALRTIHNGNYAPCVDEAIKRLSAEPCEDCISRQEALSMQYRIDDSATLSTRDVVDVYDIEDLPPVQPKAKWIPVTDAIPKLRETVLVTRFGNIEKAVRTNLTRSGEICWAINNISYEREDKTTITAWMPLPEPYETESEET